MKEEIVETIRDIVNYLGTIFVTTFVHIKPFIMWLISVISFIIGWFFPSETFVASVLFVIALSAIDIVTKLYAITKINGGIITCIKGNKYQSVKFWIGFKKKLIAYSIIILLIGASWRLHLDIIANLLNTFAYTGIVLRELYSSLENLQQAKIDVSQILSLLKRGEKEIFNISKDINDKEKDDLSKKK